LFFHKDFLYYYELPHDTVPASRSDDNRRAAGAVDFLQHSEFIIYKQKLLEFVGPAARLSVYSV
jgi:hypothetical protein